MAAPPLEAGYWVAGVAFVAVGSVLVLVLWEKRKHLEEKQKLKEKREELIGPLTSYPRHFFDPDLVSFETSQWIGFTLGPNENNWIQKFEWEILRAVLCPADVDLDEMIPKGTTAISFAFEGFHFGQNCLDFQLNEEKRKEEKEKMEWKYQMICNRVQCVYLVDENELQLAGCCLYFRNKLEDVDEDVKEEEEESELNLMAFYETITCQRMKETENRRKMEKEEKRKRMEVYDPTGEFTSSTFSHLKLCTSKDGTPVVLAFNADGKNEKYEFNQSFKRYEYVETKDEEDEEESEVHENNYLLRSY